MAQPVTGFQWTVVSGGVGTTVVKDMAGQLIRVLIPGTYTGTINFHDSRTAAGTTSSSQIYSLGIPNSNVAGNIDIGANFRNGLLYQATGTPLVTIIWE